MSALVELPITRCRLTIAAEAPTTLPPFPGPTLRGALGYTLRRLVCATHMPACAPCPLRFSCAYPLLFEPFMPPDRPAASRYTRPPTPFMLEVPFHSEPFLRGEELRPLTMAPGETLTFGLTIIGPARDHLPYYVYAVMKMTRNGLGGRHQPFRLLRVEQLIPQGPRVIYQEGGKYIEHPPAPTMPMPIPILSSSRLAIRFVTPARLDLGKDLIYPIEFHHLIQAIRHRVMALDASYGLLNGFHPDPGLIEAARSVRRVEDRTRWLDLRRYSTRQKTPMRIGGAVGIVVYESEGTFEPFAPLLALGELLHVGKLASMGLGRLEVNAP